jgi:homoserine O-succinyltransferase
VASVNTLFDVPHSRFNEIGRHQFDAAGLRVLVESEQAGVHLAVSEDGLRLVFFQGHPEYDTVSLFKEYKREVNRFVAGEREDYPPFPEGYIGLRDRALLEEHRGRIVEAMGSGRVPPEVPEVRIAARLDNTWHDTAEGVVGSWMGKIYQLTHSDRRLPFMDGIDPEDPLGLRTS